MQDLFYHWIVGNDVPPWCVALARGFLGAFIVGGLAAFNAWGQSDDLTFIIRATGVAVFGFLAVRAGIEGILDQSTKGR